MSKTNGTTTVVDPERMQDAQIKIIAAVIENGIITEEEASNLVGDKAMSRRAITALAKKKFITKGNGGPDFGDASILTMQNPDLYQGKSPLTVYLQVVGAEKPEPTEKYKNYALLDLHIELLTPCLAGSPTTQPEFLDFRRVNGKIWLPSGHFIACIRAATRFCADLPSKAGQAIRNRWVYATDVYLDMAVLAKDRVVCPVPGGKGLSRHEAIAAGTIIDFAVKYPDVVTKEDLYRIWAQAGEWIGFSVAKHNQGYGKFRLLP